MTYRAYIFFALAIALAACRKEDPCYGPPGASIIYTPQYFVGDTVAFNVNQTSGQRHWDSHGTGIFVETGTTTCDITSPHMILVSGNNVVESSVTNECGTGTYTVNVAAEPHYPGTWIQKSSMNGNREGAMAFSIGNKAYVCCGYNSTGSFLNDLWEWDQATDTWTQKANMNQSRAEGVAFTSNGKGYVSLGYDYTVLYDDLWEWDPSTNVWAQRTDYPGSPRRGASAFTIGNYTYIGTGMTATTTLSNDFWRYDALTDSWLSCANFGGGMNAYAGAFAVGGKGYLCCGMPTAFAGSDEVWEYDPAADTWTQKGNFPRRMYLTGAFTINNKGYICTGIHYGSTVMKSMSVYEYDAPSDTWQNKHGFIRGPRVGAAFCVIANSAYLAGGTEGQGAMNDFWEFTP